MKSDTLLSSVVDRDRLDSSSRVLFQVLEGHNTSLRLNDCDQPETRGIEHEAEMKNGANPQNSSSRSTIASATLPS